MGIGTPLTGTVRDYSMCVLSGHRCVLMMWAEMLSSRGGLGKDELLEIWYAQVCTLSWCNRSVFGMVL